MTMIGAGSGSSTATANASFGQGHALPHRPAGSAVVWEPTLPPGPLPRSSGDANRHAL